ncbi:MAG: hypothetical protein IKT07_04700 [Oscillospiraceae bacterium]|nr:hypothetical protein [Oscillospiraceae bacterium]
MPLKTPIVLEIDRDTWLVGAYGGVCGYALCGEERGILIDAGGALSLMPSLPDRLFGGKPYDSYHTNEAAGEQKISLGGRTLGCVTLPDGTSAYFDERSGIAFAGEALQRHMKLNSPVSEKLVGLMRLRSLKPSRIYPSHLDAPDFCALTPKTLDDAIGACRSILHPSRETYALAGEDSAAVYGEVTVSYDKNKRWAEGEHQSPYPIGL